MNTSLKAAFAALAVAVATAGAASAETRIAWSDLDLSSPTGAAAFDARVDAAARRACRKARAPGRLVSDRDFCVAAVREEALRALPSHGRFDYALARLPMVEG